MDDGAQNHSLQGRVSSVEINPELLVLVNLRNKSLINIIKVYKAL